MKVKNLLTTATCVVLGTFALNAAALETVIKQLNTGISAAKTTLATSPITSKTVSDPVPVSKTVIIITAPAVKDPVMDTTSTVTKEAAPTDTVVKDAIDTSGTVTKEAAPIASVEKAPV